MVRNCKKCGCSAQKFIDSDGVSYYGLIRCSSKECDNKTKRYKHGTEWIHPIREWNKINKKILSN